MGVVDFLVRAAGRSTDRQELTEAAQAEADFVDAYRQGRAVLEGKGRFTDRMPANCVAQAHQDWSRADFMSLDWLTDTPVHR
jgi:hypothetical protein